jgi:hypothetical protein
MIPAKTRIFPKVLLLFWFSVSALVLSPEAFAAPATQAQCSALFQQKQYEKAGHCFLALIKQKGPTTTLPANAQHAVGVLQLNAITCFEKAAPLANNQQHTMYLYEQAANTISAYLSANYSSTVHRQMQPKMRTKLTVLQSQIGYANIIISSKTDANVCLKGYRYNQCQKGTIWRLQLRPGHYKLTYTLAGQTVKDKTLTLKRAMRYRLTLRPPPRERRSLSLRSTPPGASILLNGKQHGLTPTTLQVLTGTYTVTLRKPCYLPYQKQHTIRPKQSPSIHTTLQPTQAFLKWKQETKQLSNKTPQFITIAAGGAAILASVLIFALKPYEKEANEASSVYNAATDQKTIDNARARYKEAAFAYNITHGIGVGLTTLGSVAVAGGVVWLLNAPTPKQPDCVKKQTN